MIPIAKPTVSEEAGQRIAEVLKSGMLTHGPVVEEFEKKLAQHMEYKHAVCVNTGTAALHTALVALGVGKKDGVIVPDFTFIATANAASYVGAKIKFMDVDKRTFNINPKKAVKAIASKKFKAIIPVSLYGQPYDVDGVVKAAKENGVKVISDNCQAHAAKWNGRRNYGDDCMTLSFYPTKNMTTAEGGAILTDSNELAEKCRIIRNVGMRARYEYLYIGFNYRMTSIHACIGLEQLKHLDEFNEKRKKNAKMLDELLGKVKQVKTPYLDKRAEHVYHQYTIKAEKRDELKAHLDKHGIGNSVFYPMPLHSLQVFNAKASCPVTEKVCKEVISLPVHPSLSEQDLHAVADTVKGFYAGIA